MIGGPNSIKTARYNMAAYSAWDASQNCKEHSSQKEHPRGERGLGTENIETYLNNDIKESNNHLNPHLRDIPAKIISSKFLEKWFCLKNDRDNHPNGSNNSAIHDTTNCSVNRDLLKIRRRKVQKGIHSRIPVLDQDANLRYIFSMLRTKK